MILHFIELSTRVVVMVSGEITRHSQLCSIQPARDCATWIQSLLNFPPTVHKTESGCQTNASVEQQQIHLDSGNNQSLLQRPDKMEFQPGMLGLEAWPRPRGRKTWPRPRGLWPRPCGFWPRASRPFEAYSRNGTECDWK